MQHRPPALVLASLAAVLVVGCDAAVSPEDVIDAASDAPEVFEPGPCPEILDATEGFIALDDHTWRLVAPVFESGCGRYQSALDLVLDDMAFRYETRLRICNICDHDQVLGISDTSQLALNLSKEGAVDPLGCDSLYRGTASVITTTAIPPQRGGELSFSDSWTAASGKSAYNGGYCYGLLYDAGIDPSGELDFLFQLPRLFNPENAKVEVPGQEWCEFLHTPTAYHPLVLETLFYASARAELPAPILDNLLVRCHMKGCPETPCPLFFGGGTHETCVFDGPCDEYGDDTADAMGFDCQAGRCVNPVVAERTIPDWCTTSMNERECEPGMTCVDGECTAVPDSP